MEEKITNEEVEKFVRDITNKFFRSYKEEAAQNEWEKQVRKRIIDAQQKTISQRKESTE